MRHWWQLGMRNWRVKPGRTAGALGAIALGVGVVIWVTCAHESVRLALRDQVWFWIGRSHLAVESVYSAQGTVYQSIADDVAALPNVAHVTYRLKLRALLEKLPEPSHPSDTRTPRGRHASDDFPEEGEPWDSPSPPANEVQVIGVLPELETAFRDYGEDRITGRMLTPEDTDAAVVDYKLADQLGLEIGDRFVLRATALNPEDVPTETTATFTVVGLLEHRRIAQQQRPVVMTRLDRVQPLAGYDRAPRRVTRIDMILHDTTQRELVNTERRVSALVAKHQQGFLVSNARGKMAQVEAAENQTRFLLLVVSTVALFIAFFIILSTLSMGMVERIGQLGTLRCLGMTRFQVCMLVLAEAIPLGVAGVLLGIPVGLALGKLSVLIAPEYIGHFAISRPGLILALVGGGVTTLAGAMLPMLQALRVSPLAAARPQAQPTPSVLTWVALVVGAAMIWRHCWMLETLPTNQWFKPYNTLEGVGLLYLGYALIVPALVRVVGVLAVRVAAVVLRLRSRLLSDQVGRAVWRSSAICCGLMVGLSLIVTLAVHSESMSAGWDFPKQFCEAFIYVLPPVKRPVADQARQIPGVAESCLVNTSINVTTQGRGLFNFPFSMFVAGEPDEFFNIAKLEFVEGNLEDAIAKLKRGGYILVTPEFVRSKRIGYGEKVFVKQGALFGRWTQFEIAGVVTSPALHITANYFNAGDMLVSQSVHVVLGTINDARKVFQVPDEVSLVLVNFDLPETEPPPEFAADQPPDWRNPVETAKQIIAWRSLLPQRQAEIDELERQLASAQEAAGTHTRWTQMVMARLFRDALSDVAGQWSQRTPAQRWRIFREGLVMRLVAWRTGATTSQHASVRALKLQIDHDLRRATQLFAAIPMVALLVAALGVGNLMMANVTNRTRQIAMLRAVGATRWQVTRLVIGEAIVLSTLGSTVGIALGIHAAWGIRQIVMGVWGYEPQWTIPWTWISWGVGFTLLVCLIAGLIPARRAARNNIIDALQTT